MRQIYSRKEILLSVWFLLNKIGEKELRQFIVGQIMLNR